MASRLDRSSTSVYSLCISATDGQHSTSVVVNITRYQPDDHIVQFALSFYVFDVAEDAATGVMVGRVEAFVAVVGHGASSRPPTYVILSRWANSMFHLNATYGILTLANTLDYETVSTRCMGCRTFPPLDITHIGHILPDISPTRTIYLPT